MPAGTAAGPNTWACPTCRMPAKSSCWPAACSARCWDFCGSTVIRPRSSWATPARCRWAACWDYFAIVCRQELLLVVVGGVFVVEAASVLMQVGCCKLRGRRVLVVRPLHHHFQFLGWPENKIVVRFWIASALAAIAGLGVVKLDAQLAASPAHECIDHGRRLECVARPSRSILAAVVRPLLSTPSRQPSSNTDNQPQHIVFAGGGTAGHLFPGLAVAEVLRRPRWPAITFVGTGKPFERRHVAAAGHEYLVLPSRPFSRRVREAMLFLADNVSGYYAARRFLRPRMRRWSSGWADTPAAPPPAPPDRWAFPICCSNKTPFPARPRAGWPAAPNCLRRVCRRPQHLARRLPRPCHRHSRPPRFPRQRAAAQRQPTGNAEQTAASGNRDLIVLGGSGGARP